MGKKNRSTKRTDPGNASEFKANPFAGLNLDLPDDGREPEPSPPTPETPTEPERLSPEDRELLAAFGKTPELQLPDVPGVSGKSTRRLHFHIERKRRKGKTVTKVAPFGHLDTIEQMELLKQVRRDLGVGGTFADTTMELQGDQRCRAATWFAEHGYAVPANLLNERRKGTESAE